MSNFKPKHLYKRVIVFAGLSCMISLISACAGSAHRNSVLLHTGHMTWAKVEDPHFDYEVRIRNTVDPFMWDGGSRTDREKAIQTLFKKDCASADIVDEKALQVGTYALGKPALIWIMQVKCVH